MLPWPGGTLRYIFTVGGLPCATPPCTYAQGPICVAGILLCFYAFNLPQFHGIRLAATAVLLLLFGLAALPMTYLLHFLFEVSAWSMSVHAQELHGATTYQAAFHDAAVTFPAHTNRRVLSVCFYARHTLHDSDMSLMRLRAEEPSRCISCSTCNVCSSVGSLKGWSLHVAT